MTFSRTLFTSLSPSDDLAFIGDGILIAKQSTGHEPKGNALIGGFLDLARTEQGSGIPIEPQTWQDFRANCLPTEGRILLVDPDQIKLGNAINHKAPQVLGRQCSSQADRLFQSLFVIRGLAFCVCTR